MEKERKPEDNDLNEKLNELKKLSNQITEASLLTKQLTNRANDLIAEILTTTNSSPSQLAPLDHMIKKQKKLKKASNANASSSTHSKRSKNNVRKQENNKRRFMIKLNVGGTYFTTSKSTLLTHPGSYFCALLESERWEPDDNDENDCYFIDRSPKLFEYILEYMRTGYVDTGDMSKGQIHALCLEFDYYQLTLPSHIQPSSSAEDILTSDQQLLLETWLPKDKEIGTLIYKATRDGFTSAAFHSNCDNKGSTLVLIIAQGGWLFGGYADQSWQPPTAQLPPPTSSTSRGFLFTLTNPHHIKPTKFVTNDPHYAQCWVPDAGPTFGGGHDIYVCNNSNTEAGSYTSFPCSYTDTTDTGSLLFTGSRKFKTEDVLVFHITSEIGKS